jgi:exodeoxyribonuclease V gamma subunit
VKVAAEDRSIVFHVAHSAQREVEILHDQLLHLFAHPPQELPNERPHERPQDTFAPAPPGRQLELFAPEPERDQGHAPRQRPLNPRDVVVMVPDIDAFAPAIRSVFGQHARGHARHIPWGIADLRARGRQPMLVALEWLLRAPQKRFGASEIRDLLDVPAVARRFGIAPEDGPTLVAWIEGAGIRWGLSGAQRAGLGLGAAGESNTWVFGLRRMLLGYAAGELAVGEGFHGIEPYAEVGGLTAALAGALAELLQVLSAWWADAGAARAPVAWGERLRALVADVFKAGDEDDRAGLAALDDALAAWLQACEAAGFDQAVDVAVVREAWLEAVDEPGASTRFKAGGVTFCTLLPLRAIPFEMVCLLGMNEGDYPRRSVRSDFDLMAEPGQARPGDRSRRDDDRQLMLDALGSARRVLYVSWAGRSVRDNQVQPPSVLVAQLRDYLAAGWGAEVVEARTTQHPLQPFSRRYFEPGAARPHGAGLVTYASEWRAAHAEAGVARRGERSEARGREEAGEERMQRNFTLAGLASFLRNPVKEFFRHRLQVTFREIDAAAGDEEAFVTDGLQRWALLDDVLHDARALAAPAGGAPEPAAVADAIDRRLARLRRAGRLPLAEPGRHAQEALAHTLRPMGARWQAALAEHPEACGKQPLRFVHPEDPGLVLDDSLPGLRRAHDGERPLWIDLQASVVAQVGERGAITLREDKLLVAWLRGLASAACGAPAEGLVIGPGAAVHVSPPGRDEAVAVLGDLLRACHAALTADTPLPTAVKTGLAFLRDPGKARAAFEGSPALGVRGEGHEACLARLYPDYRALSSQPGFEAATRQLYAPFERWLSDHAEAKALAAPEGGDAGTGVEQRDGGEDE